MRVICMQRASACYIVTIAPSNHSFQIDFFDLFDLQNAFDVYALLNIYASTHTARFYRIVTLFSFAFLFICLQFGSEFAFMYDAFFEWILMRASFSLQLKLFSFFL